MPGVNVAQAKAYLEALGDTPTADEARAVTGDFDPADLAAAMWEALKAAGGGGVGSQPFNVVRSRFTPDTPDIIYKAFVQSVSITGTPGGGTFKLSYDGTETTAIDHDADTAAVQAVLDAISPDGGGAAFCVVAGDNPDFTVTYVRRILNEAQVNYLATPSLPLVLSDNSLTGGTAPNVAIVETQARNDGVEVYTPADGDFPVYATARLITPWNGTDAWINVGWPNGPGAFVNFDLWTATDEGPTGDFGLENNGGGTNLYGNLVGESSLWVTTTEPVLAAVDDQTDGDPGATEGEVEVVLVFLKADA